MMKRTAILACCAMLLAVQMPAAQAIDWGYRLGVDRIVNNAIDDTVNRTVNKVEKQEKTRRVIFQELPQSAAEVGPETDAQQVAAYAVAALARYETNPDESIAMLNKLLGPRPVGEKDKQFIRDRFRGREYLMRSYFMDATPANDYQPAVPYTVEVKTNAYTYQEEGYARFLISCGGADSPRPMTVRQKASTGEWFLWDYKGLLSGIREPASSDPWA